MCAENYTGVQKSGQVCRKVDRCVEKCKGGWHVDDLQDGKCLECALFCLFLQNAPNGAKVSPKSDTLII